MLPINGTVSFQYTPLCSKRCTDDLTLVTITLLPIHTAIFQAAPLPSEGVARQSSDRFNSHRYVPSGVAARRRGKWTGFQFTPLCSKWCTTGAPTDAYPARLLNGVSIHTAMFQAMHPALAMAVSARFKWVSIHTAMFQAMNRAFPRGRPWSR